MHPRAMKVHQNAHKCYAVIPSQKNKNSKK